MKSPKPCAMAPATLRGDLLNVADNLRRALQAVSPEMREGDEAIKNFVVGVEMTEKELLSAFEKNSIKQLLPLGEKFNHDEHQAMFEVPNSGPACRHNRRAHASRATRCMTGCSVRRWLVSPRLSLKNHTSIQRPDRLAE